MKKLMNFLFVALAMFFLANCSSSKNASDLKASTGNISGLWTVSNISVDLPSGFKVSDVFDEAPYQEFMNSQWDLKRNGNGSYSLSNGTKRDIYWSLYGKGENAQFQFKKLNGEKARNVEEGYRLMIDSISNNSFIAKTPIDIGNGGTGYITYTFTK
jgi:hypothetical protein